MARRLTQLDPADAREAYDFCAQRPTEAAYVAGWIQEGGLEDRAAVLRAWLLAERTSQRISGLMLLSRSGVLIPLLSSASGAEGIAALARTNPGMIRIVVGERTQVSWTWEVLRSLGYRCNESRDQEVMETRRDRFSPVENPIELEPASEDLLDRLVETSAEMAIEESGNDPRQRNAQQFRERIRERILRGRDFVLLSEGRVLFKSNVSTICALGGQLEGVYTAKEARRQGIGRRATSWLTDWILTRGERAILHVNETNTAAKALYRSLGYHHAHRSRVLFVSA